MKAVLIVCVLALVAVAFAGEVEDRAKFELFKKEFNRGYGRRDEAVFRVFQSNLRRAEELSNAPGNLAEYGVTQFMDLSPEEFAATYLMDPSYLAKRHEVPDHQPVISFDRVAKRGTPPTYYDWRNAGVVTAVYNQEQCGDCWAFSVTETIESAWALAGHTLTQLSMQQITSCDTTDDGCGGGEPNTAYEYVINAGGLESYQDYPFTSGNGVTGYCKFDKADIVATIKSWAWVSRSASGEPGIDCLLHLWTFVYLRRCLFMANLQIWNHHIQLWN
jgi:hypothetical protein